MGTVPAGQLVKTRRRDNRYDRVLAAAARLFREKGFEAASMREIAAACEMLPGSVYYHFASKDDLLVAVHEEGIRQIMEEVATALEDQAEPWARLRAVARAHMRAILDQSDFAAVVIRVMPADDIPLRRQLADLREGYETIFRQLVADLPVPEDRRKDLRLALLGAMNWAQSWYRPDGETPEALADRIIDLFEGETT